MRLFLGPRSSSPERLKQPCVFGSSSSERLPWADHAAPSLASRPARLRKWSAGVEAVSYTHLRAHETSAHL
eukprot:13725234-Alexandrium_andersonii.AAC.1